MTTVVSDIETDSLEPIKHIWLFGGVNVETKERFKFTNILHIPEEREKAIAWAKGVDVWVFHYGLGFDVPVINQSLGFQLIDPAKVIDTVVVSQLLDYDIDDGHSLDAWGKRLGKHKGVFKDFSKLTQEMIDYWEQDLDVTLELYQKFLPVINDPKWQKSLRCEHDTAIICREIHENGFSFDKHTAEGILTEVEQRMEILEKGFQEDFPPVLTEVNRLKWKTLKDSGKPTAVIQKALDTYPKTERIIDDDMSEVLVCYNYLPFNPGSPKQRVERLWEAGWKPFEMTKTHQEYVRDRRREMQKGKRW